MGNLIVLPVAVRSPGPAPGSVLSFFVPVAGEHAGEHRERRLELAWQGG